MVLWYPRYVVVVVVHRTYNTDIVTESSTVADCGSHMHGVIYCFTLADAVHEYY